MRKPTFCIWENKDADQLRSNREADQRLCFRYIDSTIPILSKSEILRLAIFCSCRAWFVSVQVGNQNVGFLMTQLICTHLDINDDNIMINTEILNINTETMPGLPANKKIANNEIIKIEGPGSATIR